MLTLICKKQVASTLRKMKKNNPNNQSNQSVPYGQPYQADPNWQERRKAQKPASSNSGRANQAQNQPGLGQQARQQANDLPYQPIQRQAQPNPNMQQQGSPQNFQRPPQPNPNMPQQGAPQNFQRPPQPNPNMPQQGAPQNFQRPPQQPGMPQPNPNQVYSDQPQVFDPAAGRRGRPANQQAAYAAAGGRGYGQQPYAAAGGPGQPGGPGGPNGGRGNGSNGAGGPNGGNRMGPNGKPIKKKRKKKALWITLSIIAVILLIAGTIYGYYLNRYNKEIMVEQSYVDDWQDVDGRGNQIIRVPRKDKNVENFLLLGVDGGDMDQTGLRSDSMMVVSVNSKEKTIRIASLMRDIWAYYPDSNSYDKLNHAHAKGGPAQSINIINHNFDLDIQKFVVTDFNGLQNLVDVLGGIEMEISNAEAGQISGINSGGTVTLTGKQALQYARIRKIDSDFSRVERQRNVITAMLSEMKSEDLQTQINTINESMQYVQANIPAQNITGDLLSLVLSSSSGIEQMTVPEDGMYTVNSSGTWYMELDWDQQVPSLHDFLYGKRSTGSDD